MTVKCISCNNRKFDSIVKINKIPLTDNFIRNKKENFFIGNVNIKKCDSCQLVQNTNYLPNYYKYKNYKFSLCNSKFVREYMKKFAEYATSLIKKKKIKVLEIGSGDGEQLHFFKKMKCQVIGVEPSDFLVNVSRKKGIQTLNQLYSKKTNNYLKKIKFYPDIVILQYTFDHFMNPVGFLNLLKEILSDDSIVLIEVHDFDLIQKRNEICLFEHEHKIYLNKTSAKLFFSKHNFEIIKTNPISKKYTRANSIIFIIKKPKLNPKKIRNNFKKLDNFLYKNREKTIIGYGAGGRGVITAALLKNYKKISYIIDQNKSLHNLYTPKTKIKIISLDDLNNCKPDIIIVFSFGYYAEINKVIQSRIKNKVRIYSLKKFL